jgi:hypothetical protein
MVSTMARRGRVVCTAAKNHSITDVALESVNTVGMEPILIGCGVMSSSESRAFFRPVTLAENDLCRRRRMFFPAQ